MNESFVARSEAVIFSFAHCFGSFASVEKVSMMPVSAEFSAVFRLAVLRGRFFTDRDTSSATSVAVISRTMAEKYWPHGNPIGERITIDKYLGPDFGAPPRVIVGVGGDVRDVAMNQEPKPIVYIPQSQVPNGMTRLVTGHTANYLGDSHRG
jgi:hypothetical protein